MLGLIGGAFLPSSGVLGGVQVVAGLLIVGLALAQLEAPGFRRVVITPPAAWARLVRGRARDTGTAAPALLGLATLLLPCMITLSMELLAATSGSATAGAAIMAGFVLGTAPLFMVFGMVASRAAVAVRKRLAIALGVVVLGAGLYSVNDGLMMAGSPVTAQAVWRSVTGHGGDRDAM